jgi:hypothetical protein
MVMAANVSFFFLLLCSGNSSSFQDSVTDHSGHHDCYKKSCTILVQRHRADPQSKTKDTEFLQGNFSVNFCVKL